MEWPDLPTPELPETPSTTDLLTYGLAELIRRLFENLGNPEAEPVHQARVAARRIRSDIQTFGPLLRGGKQLRFDLRTLGRFLGVVRDRDVFADRLVGDADVIVSLRKAWARSREADWQRLVRYLDSGEFERVAARLTVWACVPPVRDDGERPPLAVMGPLVYQRWIRLAELARAPEPAPETLHRIRILAKRVRYGAELVMPVAGPRAAKFAERAERVQDVLGEYRDSTIAHDLLIGVGAQLPGRHAVVLGELAGMERARAEEAEKAWLAAFASLDREKLRRWM